MPLCPRSCCHWSWARSPGWSVSGGNGTLHGYQHELTFWAWELTEDQLVALEVRLENSRLARVLGLAPFLVLDLELSSPEPQRPPGTGSARR